MKGPFYIFQLCKEAALGDVYRGARDGETDACVEALRLRDRYGQGTYVLDAWGNKVEGYPKIA